MTSACCRPALTLTTNYSPLWPVRARHTVDAPLAGCERAAGHPWGQRITLGKRYNVTGAMYDSKANGLKRLLGMNCLPGLNLGGIHCKGSCATVLVHSRSWGKGRPSNFSVAMCCVYWICLARVPLFLRHSCPALLSCGFFHACLSTAVGLLLGRSMILFH